MLAVSLAVLQAQTAELAAVRATRDDDAARHYAAAAVWWRIALAAADCPSALAAAPSPGAWSVLCHYLAHALLACQSAAREIAGVTP